MYFTGDWDADCGILHDMLEGIEFYSGSERKRMLKHSSKADMGSMLIWKYLERIFKER